MAPPLVACYAKTNRGVEDIRSIFERYGGVGSVLHSSKIPCEFLIVFEKGIDAAQRCVADNEKLRDEYNITVERARIPKNYMGHIEVEIGNGVDNLELPSLMQLNDYCILHILQFLPEEYQLGSVCMRMKRLCNKKEIVRHYKGFRLTEIFHYGPLFTHLSVEASEPDDILALVYLIMFRCNNLRSLSIVSTSLPFSAFMPVSILMSCRPLLKEFVLDAAGESLSYDYTSVLKRGRSIKKLRLTYPRTGRQRYNELNFTRTASLTVLIIPTFIVNIGQLLNNFQNLRVLACVLVPCENFPTYHKLRDFYGFVPDARSEWRSTLARLGKVCPGLKNLRLGVHDTDPRDVATVFPVLEGLYLEHCYLTNDTFESFKNLKTFIFNSDHCVSFNFSQLFGKLKNLEILFWKKCVHGEIEDVLENRPDNPLTIITEDQPAEEMARKYPKINWARRLEDVYGHFSIFSVPK